MNSREGFLSVIVPAYNEEDSIADCVKRVSEALLSSKHAFEILVVNDGSTDTTLQRASSLCKSCDFVRTIDLGENFGKTIALKEGLLRAKGDLIAFFDADLQYDPKDLVKMIDLIGNGVDFVNGNRDYNGYGPSRTAFSKLYNRVVSLLFRMEIKDSNCGIKLLTRRAADPRSLFDYGLPLIVPLLTVRGFKSRELDVALHERKKGESKYFENGRFLGGRKNIWDITYHSIMLLNLIAHAPFESMRQNNGSSNNIDS
jgi:glycosyltransferase involved in cell wall biosynthesis